MASKFSTEEQRGHLLQLLDAIPTLSPAELAAVELFLESHGASSEVEESHDFEGFIAEDYDFEII